MEDVLTRLLAAEDRLHPDQPIPESLEGIKAMFNSHEVCVLLTTKVFTLKVLEFPICETLIKSPLPEHFK